MHRDNMKSKPPIPGYTRFKSYKKLEPEFSKGYKKFHTLKGRSEKIKTEIYLLISSLTYCK